jgi:uncharacterized protein (TIGR03545 family)
MPSKKAADKKDEPLIHARAKGRVFEFPVTRGYPMFWLRKAEISSKGENSVSGGDLEGRLTDVTSNPALIGKPAVLQIKADFKKQEIRGIDVRVVVDHTRETAKETLNVKVDSFPMNAVSLSDSETLKFGLDKSVAKAGLNAELHGDKFSLILLQGFEKVNYKVSSNSKMLEETLQAIVKDIPSINVKATIAGSFDDFDLSVESNLAAALQAGFQKQLQAKLVEARKRIDGLVKERVGKEQAALVARYDSAKNQLFAQVEDKKKLAESYRAQALARLDQVKKAPAPVQKAVQQLKGRLMR